MATRARRLGFKCRMFCQATGYGGTVQQGDTVEDKLRRRADAADAALEDAAAGRELTVSFNADVTDGMNWRFVPTQRSVRIHPGQSTLAFYTAHNLSDHAVTGQSPTLFQTDAAQIPGKFQSWGRISSDRGTGGANF